MARKWRLATIQPDSLRQWPQAIQCRNCATKLRQPSPRGGMNSKVSAENISADDSAVNGLVEETAKELVIVKEREE